MRFYSSLKNASPSKQEHARLEVENGEDDLVQKTEVAITLMKAVLDNVGDSFLRRAFKLNRVFSRNLSRT
jgi:hypothetical protein